MLYMKWINNKILDLKGEIIMDARLIIAILWMLAILINCIVYFVRMYKIDKKYNEKIRETDRKIQEYLGVKK